MSTGRTTKTEPQDPRERYATDPHKHIRNIIFVVIHPFYQRIPHTTQYVE